MWKFDFSLWKVYIVPTLTATQHAHGRIEYYSPRGKPSLRVTSLIIWGAICVSKRDLLILRSIRARRRQFSANFPLFKISPSSMKIRHSMTTLVQPKLIETKFSEISRGSRLVRHKKLYRVAASNRKIIGWVASNLNFSTPSAYLCSAYLWVKFALGANQNYSSNYISLRIILIWFFNAKC